MPSQDPSAATAVPLAHAPDGVGYRLLELPDGLLDAEEWTLSSDAAGLARLRAGGRTFAVRQKNTSNALVLLRVAEGGSGDANDSGVGTGLAAVATLHETVELVEEKDAPAVPAAAASSDGAAAAAAAVPPKPAAPARGKWHEKFGRTR